MADTVQEPLPAPLFQFVHGMQSFAHLFYQDISRLGCSDGNGEMIAATAMEAIKEKILSMNYDHLKARILSVDAQGSCNNGVKVHVTGYVMGTDELARNFEQTFSFAPKEGGYFILDDMFRFVEQEEVPPVEVINEIPDTNIMVRAEEVPLVEEPKVETMVDAEEVPLVEVVDNSCVVDTDEIPPVKVIHEVRDNSCVVNGKDAPLVDVVSTDVGGACMPSSSTVRCWGKYSNEGSSVGMIWKSQNQNELYLLDEVPKIVSDVVDEFACDISCVVDPKEVPLGNDVDEIRDPFHTVDTEEWIADKVHDDSPVVEPNEVSLAKVIYEVPDHPCMVKPEFKIEAAPKKSHVSNENGATSSSYAPTVRRIESTIQEHLVTPFQPSILEGVVLRPLSVEGADDYSIYIKCLPLSATPSLLEEEFKRFGAIKSGGIQVKRNKQGFCFGFVKFEEANSVRKALQASPIVMDGQQIVVDEKYPSYYRGGRGAHRFRHDGTGTRVGEDRSDSLRGGRGRARWEGLLR